MATVTGAPVGTQPTFTSSPDKYTTIDELLKVNKNDNRDLLVKTYGDQGITGFLELTGATKSAGTNDFVQYWEEQRRHAKLTVAGSPAGTGGTVTGITAVTELQLQDVVMNATTGEVFIATGLSGTDVNEFKRLAGSTSNTLWVVGDELIILGNVYDQGSEAPTKFITTDATKQENSFMIIKDKYEVNGSQATNIGWVNVGGDYRWYIHGEQETRQRFLDRREMMMLFGEQQASGTDMSSGRFPAGSEGYFAAINDRGIEVTNGSANPLDSFAEFDNIIIELDKQGAPAEYAMYVNRTQDLAIDDMLASGISTGVTAGLPRSVRCIPELTRHGCSARIQELHSRWIHFPQARLEVVERSNFVGCFY